MCPGLLKTKHKFLVFFSFWGWLGRGALIPACWLLRCFPVLLQGSDDPPASGNHQGKQKSGGGAPTPLCLLCIPPGRHSQSHTKLGWKPACSALPHVRESVGAHMCVFSRVLILELVFSLAVVQKTRHLQIKQTGFRHGVSVESSGAFVWLAH